MGGLEMNFDNIASVVNFFLGGGADTGISIRLCCELWPLLIVLVDK